MQVCRKGEWHHVLSFCIRKQAAGTLLLWLPPLSVSSAPVWCVNTLQRTCHLWQVSSWHMPAIYLLWWESNESPEVFWALLVPQLFSFFTGRKFTQKAFIIPKKGYQSWVKWLNGWVARSDSISPGVQMIMVSLSWFCFGISLVGLWTEEG